MQGGGGWHGAQWRGWCAHCIGRIYVNPSLDEVGDRGVVAQGRGLPDITAFREAAGMGWRLVGRRLDSKVIHNVSFFLSLHSVVLQGRFLGEDGGCSTGENSVVNLGAPVHTACVTIRDGDVDGAGAGHFFP